MKPRTPAAKYHFMLGTTSRVPGQPGWHYLILDIDKKIEIQIEDAVVQKTENGFHVYTPQVMRLKPMLKLAVKLGADKGWAEIALKRGYAFLADKSPVHMPWPVDRQVVSMYHDDPEPKHYRKVKLGELYT